MAFVTSFSGATLRALPSTAGTAPRAISQAPRCTSGGITPRVRRRSALAALAGAAAALAAGTAASQPARADHTLMAARRSFERYYPRINAGGAKLREVGTQLSSGNAEEVAAIVGAREFDVKFRRALNIYATSFSDNTVSTKSRDLQICISRLFDQLEQMQAAQSNEDAMEHYSLAVDAFQRYIKIARLPKENAEGFSNAKAVVMN